MIKSILFSIALCCFGIPHFLQASSSDEFKEIDLQEGFSDESFPVVEGENLVEQVCKNDTDQTITVTNENGKCTVTWVCQEQTLEASCDNGWCDCYWGQLYLKGMTYSACDSSKLMACFATM